MGLFDALFGRTRLQRPDMDRMFALSTAGPSLEEAAGLAPSGSSGVCLQPVEGGGYAQAETEVRDLMALASRDHDFRSRAEVCRDDLGFTWAVFRQAGDLTESVTLTHLVGSTLQEKGFGEQLLAAVFRMRLTDGLASVPPAAFLVYNYKRGRFYPFVPQAGGGRQRDNATEFRLSAALDRLIPVEKELTRWFALWDCPV